MARKNQQLSNNMLYEALQIFEDKKWPIITDISVKEALFNKYCERLAKLKKNNERKLVLDLTKNYLWIKSEEYLFFLNKLLMKCISADNGILGEKSVWIAPLLKEDKFGVAKSSSYMLYLMCDTGLRQSEVILKSGIKFKAVKDIKTLLSNVCKDNDRILLLDDFVGTGDTALECINYLENMGINKERLIVGGLVIQNLGFNKITEYGVPVFYAELRKKGISDQYEGEVLEEKLKLMNSIELQLRVPEKYKLGYKSSEALVSMIRTPNNTFPVFWHETLDSGLAPFVRSKYE